MNTLNNNLFTTISKAETKTLTNIVKETIAFDVVKHTTFTAANLWNIQRRGTTMIQRRKCL
ncbi:MAG: hypothetical protein WDM90_17310 [Ferruginibacter sp.]